MDFDLFNFIKFCVEYFTFSEKQNRFTFVSHKYFILYQKSLYAIALGEFSNWFNCKKT